MASTGLCCDQAGITFPSSSSSSSSSSLSLLSISRRFINMKQPAPHWKEIAQITGLTWPVDDVCDALIESASKVSLPLHPLSTHRTSLFSHLGKDEAELSQLRLGLVRTRTLQHAHLFQQCKIGSPRLSAQPIVGAVLRAANTRTRA
jgi:hypothetical protein